MSIKFLLKHSQVLWELDENEQHCVDVSAFQPIY
jgi:hypothetical protein